MFRASFLLLTSFQEYFERVTGNYEDLYAQLVLQEGGVDRWSNGKIKENMDSIRRSIAEMGEGVDSVLHLLMPLLVYSLFIGQKEGVTKQIIEMRDEEAQGDIHASKKVGTPAEDLSDLSRRTVTGWRG